MIANLVAGAALASLLAWSCSPAFAAPPEPQYTVDDLAKSFVGTPPTAVGSGKPGGVCEGKGQITGPDGLCYPSNASTAGFNLGRRSGPSAPKPSVGAPLRQASRAVPQRDLQITFKLGSVELTDQGRVNAEVFARALKTVPQLAAARFELAGYTDSSGHGDKNAQLSQQRAEAVKALLIGLGVDGARLIAHGYGAQNFLPGRPTTAPENRRVVAVKE